MDGRQRDRLAEVYEDMPRDRLAAAGREFLDGDLRTRVRKQRRWFWTAFAVSIAVAVFAAILGVVYLLERTRETADSFQRNRDERLRQQGIDPDG